jgi:hypothetical protein
MNRPLNHQTFLAICLVASIACSDDEGPGVTSGIGGTVGETVSESGESGSGDSESEESGSQESESEESGDTESSDSGSEGPQCEAQDPILQCVDGDVWWDNGCEELMFLIACDFGCVDGTCQPDPCAPDFVSEACFEGHLYWFDSCDKPSSRKQECEHGCVDGHCSPAPVE